ncbi:hypothetical protein DPB93_24840 [Salmonella enterica subsp. salamae]|nr:GNAT family N-acetyltransferase [Salmonella enterica subsp. salamae]ECI4078777.1 hypothetical protein [Salmonella enterica subsp. salamae]
MTQGVDLYFMGLCNEFNTLLVSSKTKLKEFIEQCWYETYTEQLGAELTHEMVSTLDDDSLGGLLSAEDVNVIVYMEKNKIRDSCMYAIRHGFIYIWGVYVSGTSQRSGIGRTMIEFIANESEQNRILQVIVLEVSKGAIDFYTSMGFTTKGKMDYEIVKGAKYPALIMVINSDDLKKHRFKEGEI